MVLNGADYINVNNLIITGTGATYALSCHLWNQADNNTFTNCTFNAPATGTVTTLSPFSISGSATTATAAGISGNNNILNSCTANGGYYGIALTGQSVAIPATGNQVLNCNIKEFYLYGMYNATQNGAINSGCVIERPTRTDVSTFYGIYVSSCINHMADKNRIRKSFSGNTASTSTNYGIYITGDASIGNENKFINNLISEMNGNGTLYGIYSTGADYWQAYHNTISLDFAAATTTSLTNGIYSSGTLAYDVRNNMITISRGGAATNKHCLYFTTPGIATCNYNNLFINAPGTTNVGYNGASYASLAAWQGASGYDANSVSANPSYISPATGNYRPSSSSVDNICVGLGILDDITNILRSAIDPDPGAYEFSLSPKMPEQQHCLHLVRQVVIPMLKLFQLKLETMEQQY
ncbi:MAG: hypothetical protein IPP71_08470 [Bacteroidetes bacterium]|nr:hypothetical protein [Bacteroidota bacterium]